MVAKRSETLKIWEKTPGELPELNALAHKHLEWMKIKNYSKVTIDMRRYYLSFFLYWCDELEIILPCEVSQAVIEKFFSYLRNLISPKTKKPNTDYTIAMQLAAVRNFFIWTVKKNYLLYSPMQNVAIPKRKYLPTTALSAEQIEHIINSADITTTKGIRDRAIMELLYSTGVRSSELVNLEIKDIDFYHQSVIIKEGKGKKDRMVPIGDRALKWIEKYLCQSRPFFAIDKSEKLFISYRGKPFCTSNMGNLVRGYVQKAGIKKKGSCHIFRTSMGAPS